MEATVKNSPNKREDKKQVNITWNSRLFFQIGVIVSCLLVFVIMQTSFTIGTPDVAKEFGPGLVEPPMIIYKLEEDMPQPVAPVKKAPVKPNPLPKIVKSDVIVVKTNSSEAVETEVPSTEIPVVEPTTPVKAAPATPETTTPSSILNVEHVPVFPGCEALGSNSEKIACLSSQINIFINRNFRKDLLEDLGSNQIHKVYVQFKIDTQGNVTDVRASSPNERLKNEATRVVAKLPHMKPGRQGNKNVDVVYTVPITLRTP